jgi:hypothetical protein
MRLFLSPYGMSSCLSMLEYPNVLLLIRCGVAFSAPLHHKNMWGQRGNGDVDPLNFNFGPKPQIRNQLHVSSDLPTSKMG